MTTHRSSKNEEEEPISVEEAVACERVAQAIIDVAILSAKRKGVSVESQIAAFFRVAGAGEWERGTLESYQGRIRRRVQ